MRHRTTHILVTTIASLALWACGADDQHVEAPTKDAGAATAAPTPANEGKIQDAPPAAKAKAANDPAAVDPLRHRDDVPPERRVVLIIDGEERIVDEATAKKHGYTVVDLRHDWTPFIFQPVLGPDGQEMENRYRRIFIGLANDESAGDGNPLPKNERKYLEVFGIPPSIGVIRRRFVDEAGRRGDRPVPRPLRRADRERDRGGQLLRAGRRRAPWARRTRAASRSSGDR